MFITKELGIKNDVNKYRKIQKKNKERYKSDKRNCKIQIEEFLIPLATT